MPSINPKSIKRGLIVSVLIWIEPDSSSAPRAARSPSGCRGLKTIFGRAAATLAGKGLTAMEHRSRSTERAREYREENGDPCLATSAADMWPILAALALDAPRAIDWLISNLSVGRKFFAGASRIGGDIANRAAGIDARIVRVAAINSTPDWLRTGTGTRRTRTRNFYDRIHPADAPCGRTAAARRSPSNAARKTARAAGGALRFSGGLAGDLDPRRTSGPAARHAPSRRKTFPTEPMWVRADLASMLRPGPPRGYLLIDFYGVDWLPLVWRPGNALW